MKLSIYFWMFVVFLAQGLVAGYLWFLGIEPFVIALLVFPFLVFLISLYVIRSKYKSNSELYLLRSEQAIEDLKNVRQNANKDPLTGLASRVYVLERLDEVVEIAIKRDQRCAVVFLDMDYFKEINEALGHELGNQLIARVAQRLTRIVKKGDLLGYNGGDEFIIIMPSINDAMAADLVARRITSEMAKPFELEGHQLTTSVSIGISIGPIDGSDSETLIRHAESALKDSKLKGRRAISFYSSSLNQSAFERLKIDQELRGALERDEFSIVYQPIVSDNGKNLKGFEALIRWQNERLGLVSPVAFIPIAEQIGLISEIGNWVLTESIEQLKAWQIKFNRPLVMSINVSPRQFYDESIVPNVKSCLKQAGVKPSSVQLEVTEGLFLSSSDRVLTSIDLLKKFGVRLALDDFGTGYSSLSYLNQLPFNVLKIDKSFVDGMCLNVRDRKMVQSIISLAHGLDLEVVVEGVETAQQIHELREMNADSIQGYYYSKPLTVKQAEARFLSSMEITQLNENIWDEL